MMPNDQTLGFLLHDVARLLRKRFEQRAKSSGLTRSQWQVIAYLNRNEGIQQSALAELLEVEPITLGRILDRLQDRGLVERRPHPTDRRIWQLFLRDEARPLLEQMQVVGEATRQDALAGLSDAERRQLIAMLAVLKTNLVSACEPRPDDKETDNGQAYRRG